MLFDLDGTLLDTIRDIADSVNSALAYFGFPPHELDAYRYFVGDGVEMLAIRALPEDRRDHMTVSKMVACIDESYSMRWANNTRPFRGIPELLDALTDIGIRMAILSNKGQSFAEVTVSTLLPDWHFDLVVGAHPSVPKKPDPTAALQIASQMSLIPTEFLYLGDSAVDMKTAVAANMYPVGALWGYRTADELLTGGARVLVEKPTHVVPLLND
ncbi:MAG: HAD family hydrolase [Dehalococcoidales bacterium]|nr:HAD family hydrolase [Dehalococcoidales bacterium]